MKVLLILIIVGQANGGKAITPLDYTFTSVEHCMAVGIQWEKSENTNVMYSRNNKSFNCLIVED